MKCETSDYEWKIQKLQQVTKRKNTEAVASKIDNKYMPEWSQSKSSQIMQMQAHVERLKAT